MSGRGAAWAGGEAVGAGGEATEEGRCRKLRGELARPSKETGGQPGGKPEDRPQGSRVGSRQKTRGSWEGSRGRAQRTGQTTPVLGCPTGEATTLFHRRSEAGAARTADSPSLSPNPDHLKLVFHPFAKQLNLFPVERVIKFSEVMSTCRNLVSRG